MNGKRIVFIILLLNLSQQSASAFDWWHTMPTVDKGLVIVSGSVILVAATSGTYILKGELARKTPFYYKGSLTADSCLLGALGAATLAGSALIACLVRDSQSLSRHIPEKIAVCSIITAVGFLGISFAKIKTSQEAWRRVLEDPGWRRYERLIPNNEVRPTLDDIELAETIATERLRPQSRTARALQEGLKDFKNVFGEEVQPTPALLKEFKKALNSCT